MMIEENDQSIYDEVGAAFGNVYAPAEPDAAVARGRALRRRHRTMPALAAAGVVAASLGLAMTTQAPTSSSQRSLSYDGKAVNVDNIAFSVHTDAQTGYITVTMRQFSNPSTLQAVLRQAGIAADFEVYHGDPGVVSVGGFGMEPNYPGPSATGPTGPSCQLPDGVKALTDDIPKVLISENSGPHPAFEINPSAIPAGAYLGVAYVVGDAGAQMQLIGLFSGDPKGCVVYLR